MRTPGQAITDTALPRPWGGVVLNFGSRATTMLLGLLILVVVARQGPQVQGAFSLFVAIEAALVALGSGLGLMLAREASLAGGALVGRRLRRVLGFALAAGLFAALLLAATSYVTPLSPYNLLWVLALAAPCLLFAPTSIALWMGQRRLVALNAAQVASPAIVLAMLVLLPALGIEGLLGALVAWALARALVGVGTAAWALARPAVTAGGRPHADTASGDAWRFVIMIALANGVSLANYRAMLFLVERMQGLEVAGVYSVAAQVAELLWLLSWAVTVAVYSSMGTRDAAAAVATTLHAVRLGLTATMLGAPLLAVAAWLALPALLGEAYRASLAPLVLLLPGIAAYAAASILSAYYTQHRGHPHWAAGIAGLSLALSMAIGFWAVPRWGASGAALATSMAYIVAIGVALRMFARDAGLHWSALFRGGGTRLPRPT
jgi:O-antigen/teichoic acid export membrane protein